MSAPELALDAFARIDLAGWPGLPEGLTLAAAADVVDLDHDHLRLGTAGEPHQDRSWAAAVATRYAGGLRLWLDGEIVVALEGLSPLDEAGNPLQAPDLGEPDEQLSTALGPIGLFGTESVHAARGLAVRVYPQTGVLIGVIGFAATTASDYRTRIRPYHESYRPLLLGEVA